MSKIDTGYLPNVYRTLLLEDHRRQDDIVAGKLLRFFRPGNRLDPEHPTYWKVNKKGEGYVGTIMAYGNHESKALPQVGLLRPVCLDQRVCQTVESLLLEDMAGSGFQSTAEMLLYLSEKYFWKTGTESVTIYTIAYIGEILTEVEQQAVLGL